MWPKETADLVTFTEEILNGKLHFLCSVAYRLQKYTLSNVWNRIESVKDKNRINGFCEIKWKMGACLLDFKNFFDHHVSSIIN